MFAPNPQNPMFARKSLPLPNAMFAPAEKGRFAPTKFAPNVRRCRTAAEIMVLEL